jgi:hypothetical protein
MKPPAAKDEAKPPASLFGTSNLGEGPPAIASAAKEPVKTPVASTAGSIRIDESLEKSFESELLSWEKLTCGIVPTLSLHVPVADTFFSHQRDAIGQLRDQLIELREKVNRMDNEVRDKYACDPMVEASDTVAKFETKCNEINIAVDELFLKAKRLVKHRPKGLGRPNSISAQVTPTKISSPFSTCPALPVVHPVAPMLRKEAPGGFGLVTPLKRTPGRTSPFADIHEHPRDPYLTRISSSSVKPLPSSARKSMTLSDIISGKILGPPSGTTEAAVHIRAPTVATGGHGAAWQLLRQVEQQRKQIEQILKDLEQLQ